MREEGIERETMGARGTSRHTHTQPIISPRPGPVLTTYTHAGECSSDFARRQTHTNGILAIVILYSFACTNLHKNIS